MDTFAVPFILNVSNTDGIVSVKTVDVPCGIFSRQDSLANITDDIGKFWLRICNSPLYTIEHVFITVDEESTRNDLNAFIEEHRDSRAPNLQYIFTGNALNVAMDLIILMMRMSAAHVPGVVGHCALNWIMTLNPFANKDEPVRWLKTRHNATPFLTPGADVNSIVNQYVFGSLTVPYEYWTYDDFKTHLLMHPLSRDSSAKMNCTLLSVKDAIRDAGFYIAPLFRGYHKIYVPFMNPHILMGILISKHMDQFLGYPRIARSVAAMELYTTEVMLNFALNLKNYQAFYLGGLQATAFWDVICNPPEMGPIDLASYSLNRIISLYRNEALIKI